MTLEDEGLSSIVIIYVTFPAFCDTSSILLLPSAFFFPFDPRLYEVHPIYKFEIYEVSLFCIEVHKYRDKIHAMSDETSNNLFGIKHGKTGEWAGVAIVVKRAFINIFFYLHL